MLWLLLRGDGDLPGTALRAGLRKPEGQHAVLVRRLGLLGVDAVLKDAGAIKLPSVKRVVLVGNKISPGNPVTKADGTVVRMTWRELQA